MKHIRSMTRVPRDAQTANVAQIIITFISQLLTAAIPLFGLKASSDITIPTNTTAR